MPSTFLLEDTVSSGKEFLAPIELKTRALIWASQKLSGCLAVHGLRGPLGHPGSFQG
jgi:hypothetical protein